MTTFQQHRTLIDYNKFFTYHESGINFIKYISAAFTFQKVTKQQVANTPPNADFLPEKISALALLWKHWNLVMTPPTKAKSSTRE